MTALPAGSIFFDILAPYLWIEMRTLALVVVSMFPLFAQETAPSGVYRVGGGVSPPRLVKKVEPQYSIEARKARLEGTVLLRVIVGANGKTRDLQVLRGLGLGLDENATDAVSGWEFGPGLKDGKPVNVLAQIEVNFRLLDKSGWHVSRAEFQYHQVALPPVFGEVVPPRVANDADAATATVTFDIDEKGVPVNLKIEKASDDTWARDVTDALGKWRFTLASKDGSPVSVSCTMDFVRGN
jgi:TonB family protein